MPAAPPRRASVLEVLASYARALHLHEIAGRLGLDDASMPALGRVLDDLVMDGSVSALPGHRFRAAEAGRVKEQRSGRTVEGYLSVNPRGFGFVAQLGDADDIFVPGESLGGAMHGDRVRARVVARTHKGTEGAIEEVLERRPARIAGLVRKRGRGVWLEPDDERIRGPIVLRGTDEPDAPAANDGDVAIAVIVRFPERPDENPEARLVEVVGRPGEPIVEVKKVLAVHGVIEEHAPAAVAEAEAYGAEVDPAAFAGREDLTGVPLPTIDPEDARDHDDAIWAVRNEDGTYRAWIAIADVSHYVRPGTSLDESARERGCSIYLPDRAIPMLPRALSGNLCSLLPDVLRLCLCVEVDLDATGEPIKHRIVEGFMRSRAKLTYEGVARALGLTTAPPESPAAESMREDLAVLRDLAGLLRQKRMARGALDLDLPEAKIVVDRETGRPLEAKRRAQDPGVAKAYQIVEELMLLANETVARDLVERQVPTIFRVHAPPDPEKIARFAALCEILDVPFDPEEAGDPKKLSALMKKIRAHEQRAILDTLLVRSLKQAVYDVVNIGHFGLASKAYLHFTSPIRRYPDLVVHRSVRALARAERVAKGPDAVEQLRTAATTASERERRAMQIEREVVDLHRCFLMKDAVGESFAGTVTGIVGSGVFVTLDAPFVEVLVRAETLGADAYEADETGLAMVGVRSGDRIQLGDPMMVRIEDVAILRRTIYGRRVSSGGEARDGEARPVRRTASTRGRGAKAEERGRGAGAARGGPASAPPPRGKRPKISAGKKPKAGGKKAGGKKAGGKKGRRK